MKILRVGKNNYGAFIRDYCCDEMRLARGIFRFYPDGKYGTAPSFSQTATEARFCPFCGEKFEIVKEET